MTVWVPTGFLSMRNFRRGVAVLPPPVPVKRPITTNTTASVKSVFVQVSVSKGCWSSTLGSSPDARMTPVWVTRKTSRSVVTPRRGWAHCIRIRMSAPAATPKPNALSSAAPGSKSWQPSKPAGRPMAGHVVGRY